MLLQQEVREPYYRLGERLQNLYSLACNQQESKIRRNHPAAIRQDEVFYVPKLVSSYDYLCLYVYMIFMYPDNDYQVSLILDDILKTAQRYKYQGSWGLWKKIADYFNLTVVNEEKLEQREISTIVNLNLHSEKQSIEGTVFSTYYFTEFLLNFVCSEDDLFGNIAPRAVRFGRLVKHESFEQQRRRREQAKVRKTQRHRGYRDKGSLQPLDLKIFRQANIETGPIYQKEKYESLQHVVTFGTKPTSDQSGGG